LFSKESENIVPVECIERPREKNSGQLPCQKLAHYVLLQKLGEGTFGTVYLAEDTLVGRKVALKVLRNKFASNPEFLKRFRHEAKAMGRLNHANIVSAFVVDEDRGRHFFVMEYCEGETLGTLLKRRGRLPLARALEIVLEVARALEYAHKLGFIHRDIKPDNIFLTPHGIKILDLGLSKNILDNNPTIHTTGKVAMGTPFYMAPEQALMRREVDGRCDIYSLGITLFHLLTGRPPFDGKNALAIMNKHVLEPLPDIKALVPELPPAVAGLVARMTAKKSAERFSNCTELIAAIETLSSSAAQNNKPRVRDISSDKTLKAARRAKAARLLSRQAATAQTAALIPILASAAFLALAAVVAFKLLK
jgi:serine/threonine protein kinase